MVETHYRTCHLCEAMCGVAITVDDGLITDVRGDPEDPLGRGHICPKAVGLKDIHEDPDRLRHPLKRTDGGWQTIDWSRAFDEVAERVKAVQARHGTSAVAIYQGNPTVHNVGAMMHGQLLVRGLRTRQKYSATSLDQLPHMLAGLQMFGHQLLLPVPDIDRTDLWVIFGANPLISNGSIMSAPGIRRRISAIHARGGRVIVIDPRRTETAEVADQHLFIRPGTDAILMLGLVRELVVERTPRMGRLGPILDGLDRLQGACAWYTPEVVSAATGVSADAIRRLAEDISTASSAAIYGRVGVCTQAFGGLCGWLLNVLALVTGNLDRPGGSMFTNPAIDLVDLTRRAGESGHFDRRRTRVRNLPEFGGEFPTSALAEEIDTPGEGQVRALITSCGNPVLSAPNGRRLERALEGLELMVSVDIYMNETSRHAHYILPPTFALERGHYDLAFHAYAVRNTARYCPPIFPRGPDTRHDYEIYSELARRIAPRSFLARTANPLWKLLSGRVSPEPVLDLALRTGPYGAGVNPLSSGLSLARLKKEPHGVDLGPLRPVFPEKLCTASGRVDLAPALFVSDLARLRKHAETRSVTGTLSLIGRRELRTNNSWMHNSERMVKGKQRCTLRMHPDDAAARGLEDGATVLVKSKVGSLRCPLEITDQMMVGVVSMPHGWGHHREDMRMAVASAHPGVSINDITDEEHIDALTGNAGFSDVPVTVTAVEANAPS